MAVLLFAAPTLGLGRRDHVTASREGFATRAG